VEFNLLADMETRLHLILKKPLDAEFESKPYIFFDERANEKRTGIEREIQELDFLLYVVYFSMTRYFMSESEMSFVQYLIVNGFLLEKRQRCRRMHDVWAKLQEVCRAL
jgi:hypothetical protein